MLDIQLDRQIMFTIHLHRNLHIHSLYPAMFYPFTIPYLKERVIFHSFTIPYLKELVIFYSCRDTLIPNIPLIPPIFSPTPLPRLLSDSGIPSLNCLNSMKRRVKDLFLNTLISSLYID